MIKNLSGAMLQVRAKCETIRGFRRDEEGGMIIFSLFMLVLILTLAGMAVDLMRFESTRARLQGTLDRATLAAADLDQTLPARAICEDYFNKAGMLSFLDDDACAPNEGLNFRIVNATASIEMPMFFVDLPRVFMQPFSPGLSTMNISGTSTAEERVTDVEISLVLDVSSSMNSNSRIANLRPAAREFVTTVLANNTNTPQGLITISMVPYSAVVNPGTAIVPHLTGINRTHDYSTCPLFDDSLFTSTALDLGGSYDHVSHFDPDWFNADPSPIADPWCYTDDLNAIFPVSANETKLHEAIDALEPYGNTAIDMGMKWGIGLLDPSTEDLITSLAGTTDAFVPLIADGRPEALGQDDILKVVVLMTDGQNTSQYDLLDRFKTGLSYIWFDQDYVGQPLNEVPSNRISVQRFGLHSPEDFTDDLFYWNPNNNSRSFPRGFSSQQEYVDERTAAANNARAPGSGVTYTGTIHNASWQDLYAYWEHNRVNNELLLSAYNNNAIPWNEGFVDYTYQFGLRAGAVERIYLGDYSDADNAIDYGIVVSNEADARLKAICKAARDQDIIIYTVAFEAPSAGRAALEDCASSTSHYFDVNGTDISAAFATIASDIRNLKLTQ